MTDDVDLAEDLRAAVGGFVRRVRAHDTMPFGQTAVLGYLGRGGTLSIADLARREQVRHQSMTRTVNLLADQGLVTLSPAETDRRQVAVLLTPAGADRLAEVRRTRAAAIATALREQLTPEERAIVARIPEILRKVQP
ncbi:MAG: MarR family transcriptional regulator [Actinoplanes sp.]